jgi:hypothetical protein
MLLYSVGYSIAVFDSRAWLGGIARVNIAVAFALIAVICVALTPLLSPYRLAANSQFRLVLERVSRSAPGNSYLAQQNLAEKAAGIYVDLNDDKSDEFVFMTEAKGSVYESHAGQWVLVGNVFPQPLSPAKRDWDLVLELTKGDFSTTPPKMERARDRRAQVHRE